MENSKIYVLEGIIAIGDSYYIYLDTDWLKPGDFNVDKTVSIKTNPRKVRRNGIFCYKYEIEKLSKDVKLKTGDLFWEEPKDLKVLSDDQYYYPEDVKDLLLPGIKFEEKIPANTYSISIIDFSKTPPKIIETLSGNDEFWQERIVPDFNPPWEYRMGEYEMTDMTSSLIMKTAWMSEMKSLIENKAVRIKK